MNFIQLREQARNLLDDNKPEKYGWSDSELGIFINQAIREAAIRSRAIIDSTNDDCSKITLSANVSKYPVHGSVFFVDRVYDEINKRLLAKTSFNDLDEISDDWPSHTGKPQNYICGLNNMQDFGNGLSITIYPIPTESATLKLTVYRSQLYDLAGQDEPEIPNHRHYDLLYWVCHLAYMKQDADSFNAEKSLDFRNKFDASFGMAQDGRQLEWRRKHVPLRVKGQFF